jgi:hypothetical protein
LLLQESVYYTTQGRFYFPTCRNVPAKYVTSGQFYLFKCREPALWVSSLWSAFLLSRPALIIATVTNMQGGDFFRTRSNYFWFLETIWSGCGDWQLFSSHLNRSQRAGPGLA